MSTRPWQVTTGVAILAALFAYGAFLSIEGGILALDASQRVRAGILSHVVQPFLILGIWVGVGSARVVDAVLFAGRMIALAGFMAIGGGMVDATSVLLFGLHIAALVLLFLPASNVWFRARLQARKASDLQPFVLGFGIVFGTPLVLLLLMTQPGTLMGPVGSVLAIALMFIFFVPAAIFGRPHFMFGIGAGPADDTGWVLTIAFYVFVAVALGGVVWSTRAGVKSRRAIAIVVAALVVPLIVIGVALAG